MELSTNSWHKTFYEFWWAKDAPNNLCNYFWGLLLAIVTLPLIAGRIMYEGLKETPRRTPILGQTFMYLINTIVVVLASALIGALIGLALFEPIKALASFGCFVLSGLIFAGILYFFNDSETYRMTVKAVKFKKQKVCPRITWK